jgi:voltage-gated potassium channel
VRGGAGGRRLDGALLRGIGGGSVGLVLFAVLPVPSGPLRRLDAALFALGLLGFAGAVAVAAIREHRVRLADDRSDLQGAQVEHVLAIVLWAIAFFALVYARLSQVPDELEGMATRLDALYFTVTTLTTVGFGDIRAVGQTARLVVLLQMVFNVTVIAAAVRVLLSVARRGEKRRP